MLDIALIASALFSIFTFLFIVAVVIYLWRNLDSLILGMIGRLAQHQQRKEWGQEGGTKSGISKHTKKYKQELISSMINELPFGAILSRIGILDMIDEDPDAVINILQDPGIQGLIQLGLGFAQQYGGKLLEGLMNRGDGNQPRSQSTW